MKTINIRSVPDDLYKRLWRLARANRRSLSTQVIILLSKLIENEEYRNQQADILNSIRSRRFKAPTNTSSTFELLQEDRGR